MEARSASSWGAAIWTRRAFSGWLCLLASASVALGCAGEGGSVRPVATTALEGVGESVFALPDGRLLMELDDRAVVFDPDRPERDSVVLGNASTIGRVLRAVSLEGDLLVLTDRGLFLLAHGAWMRAPISDALEGSIVDLAALEGPAGRELWIATEAALYRVVDGRAQRSTLDEDLSDVSLAVARRPNGAQVLWARLPDRILELRMDGTRLEAARVVIDPHPARIEADAAGRVWLLGEDRLRSVEPSRRVRDHGGMPERLLAAGHAGDTWLLDGARSRVFADGSMRELEDWEAPSSASAATVAADGSLYTVVDGRLERVASRHRLRVVGPNAGAVLVTPVDVRVEAEGPNPTIEARVGNRELTILEGPLRFRLDPSELGDGAHALTLEVSYEDGTLSSRREIPFEVISTASWATDVAPLYDDHCGDCHGVEGPASTRLDEPSLWRPIMEVIVLNVRDGRMPLGRPPLSQREVALIEAWALSDFPD